MPQPDEPVRVVRPEPPRDPLLPRPGITSREVASLERVAALRGYAGQLRAAIRDALDNAAPGTTTHAILVRALEIPNPDQP